MFQQLASMSQTNIVWSARDEVARRNSQVDFPDLRLRLTLNGDVEELSGLVPHHERNLGVTTNLPKVGCSSAKPRLPSRFSGLEHIRAIVTVLPRQKPQ